MVPLVILVVTEFHQNQMIGVGLSYNFSIFSILRLSILIVFALAPPILSSVLMGDFHQPLILLLLLEH